MKFERIEHGMADDFEYRVNGKTVARVDYDADGWQGMERVRDMFSAIANQLGVEVEELHSDEE